MRYTNLTPNLMVDDVNATIDFYTSVLGLELRASVPETGSYNWALVARDGIELMLQKRESLIEELPELAGHAGAGVVTLYVRVDDVETLYEQVKESAVVVTEPHTTFYGAREFVIRDPNGYYLYFGEIPS